MSDKLKPCPLCFNRGVSIHQDHNGAIVFCTVCETAGPCRKCLKDAITDWNVLPRHLHWTTETPTEPGWYWQRRDKEDTPLPVRVENVSNLLAGSQWAGPIPEPEEPR